MTSAVATYPTPYRPPLPPSGSIHRPTMYPTSLPPQSDEQYRRPIDPPLTMHPFHLPPISSLDPRHQSSLRRPLTSSPPPPQLANSQPPSMNTFPAQTRNSQPYYVPPMSTSSAPYLPAGSVLQTIGTPARYALPPVSDPHNIMSGRKPGVKEVKRRTKTGCMTCRKRRIKCDEGHPTCRNCVKSKRDCLGYDPIFRSSSGPSSIQPSPNPNQSSLSNSPSQPYQSSVYTTTARTQSQSINNESPRSSIDQVDFPTPTSRDTTFSPPAPPLRADGEMTSSSTGDGSRQPPERPFLPIRSANQIQIEDLWMIDGVVPPPVSTDRPIEQANYQPLESIYLTTFANGLDDLLETRWFSKSGLSTLLSDEALLAQFSAFVDDVYAVPTGMRNYTAAAQEARLIWKFLCMCRTSLPAIRNMNGAPMSDDCDPLPASRRLDILEALMTGRTLQGNPLDKNRLVNTKPYANSPMAQQLKDREIAFWFSAGQFVSSASGPAQEQALSGCRAVLDTYENRDVLYSIMLMHVIGNRFESDDAGHYTPEAGTAEEDWTVATRFLAEEASGLGRNAVIVRICGMALRSFGT